MTMQAFTDNYQDNSTEAGFQFTFFCDICHEGYKTNFEESHTYKKGKFFGGLGKAISFGASLIMRSVVPICCPNGSTACRRNGKKSMILLSSRRRMKPKGILSAAPGANTGCAKTTGMNRKVFA